MIADNNSTYYFSSYTVEDEETDHKLWNGWSYGWIHQGTSDPNEIIAHGLYRLSVSNTNDYIIIDLRDAVAYNPDLFISYHPGNGEFRYHNGTNFVQISNGELLRIWDIKNAGNYYTNNLSNYWENCLAVVGEEGDYPRLIWGPYHYNTNYSIIVNNSPEIMDYDGIEFVD
jgi:hypothetical protein